ncbi:hypothetical protein ABT294_21220 [Nonomuraea sp. NPDC000554]|uniref:hypothetical protein n=1 Tax=Nonomuraea sp. NPDC000554 TaxID=3154259 RepID=UPI0033280657
MRHDLGGKIELGDGKIFLCPESLKKQGRTDLCISIRKVYHLADINDIRRIIAKLVHRQDS